MRFAKIKIMTPAPSHKTSAILKWFFALLLLLCLSLAILFFSKENFTAGVAVLFLPFVLVFLSLVFSKPIIGFKTLFFVNYFVMGLACYVPGPLGLSVYLLLVLTWLSLFFSQFNHKVEWEKAWNGLTIAAIIWFLYIIML
jgi:hypothetical protein